VCRRFDPGPDHCILNDENIHWNTIERIRATARATLHARQSALKNVRQEFAIRHGPVQKCQIFGPTCQAKQNVRLNGRDFYLRRHGSTESLAAVVSKASATPHKDSRDALSNQFTLHTDETPTKEKNTKAWM
jgi:hypothetical protein